MRRCSSLPPGNPASGRGDVCRGLEPGQPGAPPGRAGAARGVLRARSEPPRAHALAHGVAQNGFAPGSYPGTRMLADLLDLGMGDPDAGSLWDEVSRLVSHVRPGRSRAVSALCAGLRTAEALPGVLRRDGPPAEVLARPHRRGGHRPRLSRVRSSFARSGADPPAFLPWRGSRDAARALCPSRAEVEGLHGGPLGALRATGLRLARPFDLAAARPARRPARGRGSAAPGFLGLE